MTPTPKVVLLEDRFADHAPERRVLEPLGMLVVEGGQAHTTDEIVELCHDADGITVNLTPITAAVIAGLERCRVIARYGVGYDTIDVEAATARGILVVNVPDYCYEDVSDHAVALWLACVRKTAIRDRQVRAGLWDIGWYSEESQVELQTKAAQGVADVLAGRSPAHVVNRSRSGSPGAIAP